MVNKAVNPPAWGRPTGYSNGMEVGGVRLLFLAGQIGARPRPDGSLELVPGGLAAQFEQALRNVVEVVEAAGGGPQDLVEMTVYVTRMDEYRESRKALGEVWKRHLGRHYPAMTLIEASDLFEKGAFVEIRAIASLGAR